MTREEFVQSIWHSTKHKTPEDGELVFALPQRRLLVWNEFSDSWDDPYEGEEYCRKYFVEQWMEIPKL